jgi:hypothetical protein
MLQLLKSKTFSRCLFFLSSKHFGEPGFFWKIRLKFETNTKKLIHNYSIQQKFSNKFWKWPAIRSSASINFAQFYGTATPASIVACLKNKDKLNLRKNRRKMKLYSKIKKLLEEDSAFKESGVPPFIFKQLDNDLNDPRVQSLLHDDKKALKSAVMYYKEMIQKFESFQKIEEEMTEKLKKLKSVDDDEIEHKAQRQTSTAIDEEDESEEPFSPETIAKLEALEKAGAFKNLTVNDILSDRFSDSVESADRVSKAVESEKSPFTFGPLRSWKDEDDEDEVDDNEVSSNETLHSDSLRRLSESDRQKLQSALSKLQSGNTEAKTPLCCGEFKEASDKKHVDCLIALCRLQQGKKNSLERRHFILLQY